MSKQYDSIGISYKSLDDLPLKRVQNLSLESVLGDITGLRCLDLACGLGPWSEYMIKQGASFVRGIDISSTMISEAQKSASSLPRDLQSKLEYAVKDCILPFDDGSKTADFDLVLAAFFLNYAETTTQLKQMFRSMFDSLKPGGRVVALQPNAFTSPELPGHPKYGIQHIGTSRLSGGGWKVRVVANVEPEKVELDTFWLPWYEVVRAAEEVGLRNVRWHPCLIPEKEVADEYWDIFRLRPTFCLFSTERV